MHSHCCFGQAFHPVGKGAEQVVPVPYKQEHGQDEADEEEQQEHEWKRDQDGNDCEWVPWEVQLGMPLADLDTNKRVCEGIQAAFRDQSSHFSPEVSSRVVFAVACHASGSSSALSFMRAAGAGQAHERHGEASRAHGVVRRRAHQVRAVQRAVARG